MDPYGTEFRGNGNGTGVIPGVNTGMRVVLGVTRVRVYRSVEGERR